MPRYAVSYIDWLDYDLTTVLVEDDDWRGALLQHPKVAGFDGWPIESLEDCKKAAFDWDCMVECLLISDVS